MSSTGGAQMSSTSEELRSVGFAAERFQVSTGTVRNWIEKGYIRAVRLPSGHHKLPDSEISKLLSKMFELPTQLEEESLEPAPRRRRQEVPPDEWGPAI